MIFRPFDMLSALAAAQVEFIIVGGVAGRVHKASVLTAEIVPLLSPIIKRYATERTAGERFGDFVIRAGYVKPTFTAHDFHEQAKVTMGAQI